MNKRGITMTSIVIYVVLFFIFTSIAIGISSNMNYESLSEKGNIINHEEFQKLQYNMLNSAKKSNEVYNINGKIVFSNNDEYDYNEEDKTILKNDHVLIQNVENFSILPSNDLVEIKDPNKGVAIEVTLKKYGSSKSEKMIFSVGDNVES
ncbi:MAG: hypothetical protein Q4D02_06770 [Clostridia bacterium]|nr:hypothetical protein [Clostridia bacterium]